MPDTLRWQLPPDLEALLEAAGIAMSERRDFLLRLVESELMGPIPETAYKVANTGSLLAEIEGLKQRVDFLEDHVAVLRGWMMEDWQKAKAALRASPPLKEEK